MSGMLGLNHSEETKTKMSKAAKALDQKALSKQRWSKRHRAFSLIDPNGKRWRTKNLTNFARRHNLTLPRLSEIASFHACGIRAHKRGRLHRGWDCWREGTLPNNKRRVSVLDGDIAKDLFNDDQNQ